VGVDSTGNYTGAIWTTSATDPCCASMTVTEGATYGSSLAFAFPSTLADGTLHLYVAGYAVGATFLGVDLFFDSATTSGAAAQITVLNDGTNTISGSGSQPGFGFGGSNPNGSLSYSIGGRTVTASNFHNIDLSNSIVAFDLTTGPPSSGAAPEPASFVLLGGALIGISIRYRRQRSQ
jgi:hypothetical protein